jgi:acyl-CoA synthetase (AMP-forming)/AMP-acid ligase II
MQNAIATAFENKSGNTEIALFIEGTLPETSDLLDFLKARLPDYMIPSKIINQETFPLNANGKIDRNMLKKSIIV